MAEGDQNKHLHWKKGSNQTHYFLKSLITFPCFWHLQTAWRREKFCGWDVLAKPDSTCWSSSSLGSKSELKKKNPIPGETTKTCTSKNETKPQHKWRRQTQGRVWALPKGTCWKLQFFTGRLYWLPVCMIASKSMASSFQDFPAEIFASCSPDDSHLVLETIFSCFYFSTRSWRAPAIYVVDISLLLAPLGRSSTRQLLGAEPAHHSSFCVFHTAKPRALLRLTAAVSITMKTDNGKQTNQGKSNRLQLFTMFARPFSGWFGQRSDDLDTEGVIMQQIQRQLCTTEQ